MLHPLGSPCEDIPEPPLIFIPIFDTCEGVLRKVQGTRVKQDRFKLELNHSICSRCDLTIIKQGKPSSMVAHATSPDQPGSISVDETTCHPMMVPKYTKLQRFFGGIAPFAYSKVNGRALRPWMKCAFTATWLLAHTVAQGLAERFVLETKK